MDSHDVEGSSELAEVLRRLEGLQTAVNGLQERLAALEHRGVHPPVPAPPPPAAAPAPSPPPSATLPPVAATPVAAPSSTAPARVLKPAAAPASAAPASGPRAPRSTEGWEMEIGLKWMGRAGAVALILAALYFLQYAFVNGLIGPVGQVLIGLAAGLGLLVLGDVNLRRERRALGEALLGAGIALLYVSVFAAANFYRPPLLSYTPAFGFLIVVTGLAVALAVRADAQSTALLAALGGFLTPVMLHRTAYGGEGFGGLVQLFTYVTILDLGLLALVFHRRWRALQVLAFVGSWLIVWGWLGRADSAHIRYLTLYPALVLFAIFLLVPVLRNLRQQRETHPEELGLILANPACFFPTLAVLAAIYYPDYLGLLAIVLALVYLMLGWAAWQRQPADRLLSLTWLSLGLAFVTLAIPLQFKGEWVMLAWGMEGTLLVWIGLRLQTPVIRVIGALLQAVVFGWLLLLFTLHGHERPDLVCLNPLFLSFLGGAATLVLTLLQYQKARVPDEEATVVRGLLGVALGLLALWGVTCELGRSDLPGHLMLAWWAVVSAVMVVTGMHTRVEPVRVAGLLVQVVVVVWMLLLYVLVHKQYWLSGFVPLFNELFVVFLLGLLSVGVSLTQYHHAGRDRPEAEVMRPLLAVLLTVLGLWGLTADVGRGLSALTVQNRGLVGMAGFGISLVWCLYASALVGFGISRRQREMRTVGLIIFALAVVKVFAWDSQALERLWRILSFVCLGLILIGVSYLYHLYGDRLRALFSDEAGASGTRESLDEPPNAGD